MSFRMNMWAVIFLLGVFLQTSVVSVLLYEKYNTATCDCDYECHCLSVGNDCRCKLEPQPVPEA